MDSPSKARCAYYYPVKEIKPPEALLRSTMNRKSYSRSQLLGINSMKVADQLIERGFLNDDYYDRLRERMQQNVIVERLIPSRSSATLKSENYDRHHTNSHINFNHEVIQTNENEHKVTQDGSPSNTTSFTSSNDRLIAELSLRGLTLKASQRKLQAQVKRDIDAKLALSMSKVND